MSSLPPRPRNCRLDLSGLIAGLSLATGLIFGSSLAKADIDPSDPAAVRSRIVVQKIGEGKEARSVVILGKSVGNRDIPDSENTRLDILPREFARQALLIAARDGLGLVTRDEVIDETSTEKLDRAGSGGLVELVSLIRGNKSTVLLRRVADKKSETLETHDSAIEAGRRLDLMGLLSAAEVLSREGFPQALKRIGLEGKPNRITPNLGAPIRAEDQLTGLGLPETLGALRDIHEAIRSEGESPERIGALVRAYAQLGVLSEFHWHPAHKAYKARSLLYAQRLVAKAPDDPWGLWHRAYALALVGRHQDALNDLAAASKLAAAKKGRAKVPSWVSVIEACARCDSKALLESAKEGPHTRLAALLRMTTLEFPRQTAVALQAAKDVITAEPLCFRAHDATCDYRGVSTQHMSTMLGPEIFERELPEAIRTLPNLPDSARLRLEGRPTSVEMAKALDQSGDIAEDRGEPSWAALAHLVRETRFAQVYRRLNFLRYMLVVNAGDYWNEVLLDVAGHRYRPYLETFVVSPQEASRSFPEFIDSFDLTDIESTELPMIEVMVKSQRPKGTVAWTIAQCHDDETARDIAVSLGAASEQSRAILARDLFAISPHHPRARAVLIQTDWDQFKDQAATWEKESGDSPTVLAALYSRYFAEKRFEDARRVIEGYIKKSPDRWAYEQLAYVYKTQGMMDRWKSTLDDYLQNVEDLGLDHAQVRVGMAEYFMAKGEWSKARPYAEDAAETWAEWAMLCAGRCAEGEKDWDRAEEWFIRSAQRYTDSSWLRWYLFCNRTGHGNIEEARAFADQYIAAHAERTDLVWLKPEALAYYYWIDGRIAEAKAKFAEGFEKQGAVSALISLAMIADDERDKARRDQLLDEICTKHKAKAPLSIGVCQTLRDSILAPGGKKPVDRAALKHQIDSIPEAGRGYVQFFVGWFLKNNDDQELAKSYLKAAAADTKSNSFWHKSFSEKALKELSAK